MGLVVYLEDQNHQRMYAGGGMGSHIETVLLKADPRSLLTGIHIHGDTMFNSPQLIRIIDELDALVERNPEMQRDANELKMFFEDVIKRRGYVWISGD